MNALPNASRVVSSGELVQDYRRDQLHAMKHIYWLWSGLAWSCDATEYGEAGWQIIPVQDLASRYRFRPLVSDRLDGRQIAAHLESLFRQHGAPLFLKRDNGSPFNNQHVDAVMARFGVLPLNNPPHFPRYNGAQEKSIRDLKAALDQRLQHTNQVAKDLAWRWKSPPMNSITARGAVSKAAPPVPSCMTTPNDLRWPNASAKPFSDCCSHSSER